MVIPVSYSKRLVYIDLESCNILRTMRIIMVELVMNLNERRFIIDLHAPASPYLVVEFIKVVSSFIHRESITPVITRPTGLAAQSGVPEAWRIAYKNNIPMIVLPDIKDVIEIYKPDEIVIFQKTEESKPIEESLELLNKRSILVVIPSGEQALTKEEQILGKKIHSRTLTRDTNPLTILGIILVLIGEEGKLIKETIR